MKMRFEMKHRDIPAKIKVFTDTTAPDWLTSVKTAPGSTMDMRWFWYGYVLPLKVGESVETDFQNITRVE